MTGSHVQGAQATGTGASASVTVASTGTTNLVVVSIKYTDTTKTVTSVTDGAGNTYEKALGPIDSLTMRGYQYYGVQVAGGVTAITVNFSGSVTYRVQASEFSGYKKTNATVFDKAASSTGGATSTSATNSISPTSEDQLIVNAFLLGAVTSNQSNSAGYSSSITSNTQYQQYKLDGTTSETPGLTWTTQTNYIGLASTFIPEPRILLFGNDEDSFVA